MYKHADTLMNRDFTEGFGKQVCCHISIDPWFMGKKQNQFVEVKASNIAGSLQSFYKHGSRRAFGSLNLRPVHIIQICFIYGVCGDPDSLTRNLQSHHITRTQSRKGQQQYAQLKETSLETSKDSISLDYRERHMQTQLSFPSIKKYCSKDKAVDQLSHLHHIPFWDHTTC